MSIKQLIVNGVFVAILATQIYGQSLFSNTGGTPSQWTAEADALVWDRDEGDSQPLTAAGVIPEWNVQEMTFQHHVGARLSLFRALDDQHKIEANWFGMDGWSSTKTRNQAATIVGPGFTYTPTPTDHLFVYSTALHSGEINIWRQVNENVQLGAGFRLIQQSEEFASTSGGVKEYCLNTNNHLYGGQLAAKAILWETATMLWRIVGTGKTALLGNSSDATAIGMNSVVGNAGDSDMTTAFVAEGGIAAVLVLTNGLELRGGYQCLWLTGIGTAPSLLSAPNTGTVTAILNAQDDIFYHGGFLGLIGTF